MTIQCNKNRFEAHPRITLTVVVICAFFVLGIGLELFFRMKEKCIVNYKNYGIERKIVLREGRPFASFTIKPERLLLWRSDTLKPQKYTVRFDENGFMEPSKIHDNPDISIVFLGGSTTFCEYNQENNRFPYLTGRILERETGKKINAYNASMNNNNSLHSINILYNKVIPLKPDIVILMHNTNDLCALLHNGSYWNNKGTFPPIVREPRYRIPELAIIKNIKFLIDGAGGVLSLSHKDNSTESVIDSLAIIRQFEQNISIFIALCRASGSTPVLMTQASRLTENPDPAIIRYHQLLSLSPDYRLPLNYDEFRIFHAQFNQVIRRVGKEKNVLVIDLDKAVPPNSMYMYDAYHLTDEGCRLVSEYISARLMDDFFKYVDDGLSKTADK